MFLPLALLAAALSANPALAAEKMTAPQLIGLAQSHSAGLQDAITAAFSPKDLQEGTAMR
jgi:hypothetical protein